MRSIRTSQPSASSQPASWLRGGLLRPLLAVADHGNARLDDHEVPALERRRGDHPVDGDAVVLVEADHRRVLAAAPPLVALGDDRPLRDVDARVAREDLVGEGGIRLEEVHPDARLLVDADHLGVLALRVLAAEAQPALERGARDGAGGEPVEVVGWAEQDVEQASILRVDSPCGLCCASSLHVPRFYE